MNQQEDYSAFKEKFPFIEHFVELRQRVIRVLIVFTGIFFLCFLIKDYVLEFLLWPYKQALGIAHLGETLPKLQSTEILETFLTKTKLAAFSSFLLSSPYVFYQFYSFVAPGLYQKEKKIFFQFLFFAPLLFLIGLLFVYFILTPVLLWFSLMQQGLLESNIRIELFVKISSYLNFIMHFMIIFGMIFQLPLVLVFLKKSNIVDKNKLVSWRRWVVISAFIFAAIITPPDVFTMFGVAIPLLLLYEAAILIVAIIEKKEMSKNFLKN